MGTHSSSFVKHAWKRKTWLLQNKCVSLETLSKLDDNIAQCLYKHRPGDVLARSGNPPPLSALRQSWCSWNRSVPQKKYTWPFPIHTSIMPALCKACWGLDPAQLPFSAQKQGSLTAFQLKSSRKLLPQTQILCQFRDRYSTLCWFWMWNQHWPDHGNWVAALNLERHSALLNGFKCS